MELGGCRFTEGQKGCRVQIVFTIKSKTNGNVERYKARFVAKGFTQTYDIDSCEAMKFTLNLNLTSLSF